MNKKCLSILLMLLLAAGTCFAQATSEDYILYNKANTLADEATSLFPQQREIILNLSNGESYQASVTNEFTQYGSSLTRYIQGSFTAVHLLDHIYDGRVLTPFNNDILKYDEEFTKIEDGNYVYEVSILADLGLFFFDNEETGNLIGGDFNSLDSDEALIEVFINPITNQIVKQIAHYEIPTSNMSVVQTALFSNQEVDGISYSLPYKVTTTASFKANNGIDLISFEAVELLKDYVYLN